MSDLALPPESPMRNPIVREEVKKALQRISRRLETHNLTTRDEALCYVNANFAGIHGFGPTGLTEAELSVMWEDSIQLCVAFMLHQVYPQMKGDLERSRQYLLRKRKRFTEWVVNQAFERNRQYLAANGPLAQTAAPSNQPLNTNYAAYAQVSDPQRAPAVPQGGPEMGTSALYATPSPNDIAVSMANVQLDPRLQQVPSHLAKASPTHFGLYDSTSAAQQQQPEGGFRRPNLGGGADQGQQLPPSVGAPPQPMASAPPSAASTAPTQVVQHPAAAVMVAQQVQQQQQRVASPAPGPVPFATNPNTSSASSVGSSSSSSAGHGSPQSTATSRGLDGDNPYADLKGNILDIINSYYREASPSETSDLTSMLYHPTFTIRSVRNLQYHALTNRFSQVCERAAAQLGAKADTFMLISMSHIEDILPKLLTVANGFDLRGSPLSVFTCDTSALQYHRPRFIVVADVVAEAASPQDASMFNVVNTGYIYPCNIIELEWS